MQISGTCVVRKDGRTILSSSATMTLGGFERTDEYADHGLIGYSQKPISGKITATVKHHAGYSLQDLMDTTNSTISFESDTGARFTMAQAFATAPPELASGNGEVQIEFKGKPMLEETA